MTDHTADAPGGMGTFERWLSLWVALAMGVGLLLGNLLPGVFQTLASAEIAPNHSILDARGKRFPGIGEWQRVVSNRASCMQGGLV